MIPNATKLAYIGGSIDLSADTIRVALYDNSTTFTSDPDAHATVADILDGGTTAQEMSGGGYERKTLANQTTTQDDTDDRSVFDADNVTWEFLDAGTIQGVVVYQQVGGDDTTPGDDRVLFVIDDGSIDGLPLTTNGSDVVIDWADIGIKTLS